MTPYVTLGKGGGCLKTAEKVSRIIWMAPSDRLVYNYQKYINGTTNWNLHSTILFRGKVPMLTMGKSFANICWRITFLLYKWKCLLNRFWGKVNNNGNKIINDNYNKNKKKKKNNNNNDKSRRVCFYLTSTILLSIKMTKICLSFVKCIVVNNNNRRVRFIWLQLFSYKLKWLILDFIVFVKVYLFRIKRTARFDHISTILLSNKTTKLFNFLMIFIF